MASKNTQTQDMGMGYRIRRLASCHEAHFRNHNRDIALTSTYLTLAAFLRLTMKVSFSVHARAFASVAWIRISTAHVLTCLPIFTPEATG